MSAKQLDENKIKLGNVVRVANQEKKIHENEQYIAIQIQNEDGNNERCILLTEIEFSDMQKITFEFAKNKMIAGRLYNAIIDKKQIFLVKINNGQGNEYIYRLSKTLLNTAQERAGRNPEDLTKKSWFIDLKD